MAPAPPSRHLEWLNSSPILSSQGDNHYSGFLNHMRVHRGPTVVADYSPGILKVLAGAKRRVAGVHGKWQERIEEQHCQLLANTQPQTRPPLLPYKLPLLPAPIPYDLFTGASNTRRATALEIVGRSNNQQRPLGFTHCPAKDRTNHQRNRMEWDRGRLVTRQPHTAYSRQSKWQSQVGQQARKPACWGFRQRRNIRDSQRQL